MLVSIITATYNSSRTIRETLDSVRGQTYPNIEHVIIDGLSTDDTLSIIEERAPNALCYSGKDEGIYDAMNKGIAKAKGDVIAILNSDDRYAHKDVIKNVVDQMSRTESDTLYGDLKYVHEFDSNKVIRTWKAGEYSKKKFEFGWMPPHPTFFVTAELYQKYGTFTTELRSAADYELMLRFLYKNDVSTCYLPECLVYMRAGGQSNATLKNRIRANREDRRAWEMNGLRPKFYTIPFKPLRKVGQFLSR